MNQQPSSPLQLEHLCGVDVVLGAQHLVGDGASGTRVIVEVTDLVLTGDRLNGRALAGAADWVTIAADVATIDVRATVETDDGALVYVSYRGRSDATAGVGAAPIYVAPVFETGDPRYSWLNRIQAVGKGELATLHYDWYELR